MKSITNTLAMGLGLPLLVVACQSGPERLDVDRYSTDKHVAAVQDNMYLHTRGASVGPYASELDSEAMRQRLSGHRSSSSQAADGATNEMPMGMDMPGPVAVAPAFRPAQFSRHDGAIVIAPKEAERLDHNAPTERADKPRS